MGRRRYLKACGLIMTVGVLSIALVKITANSGINNQANYQSRHLQQTTGGISFLKEKVKQRVAAGANFVSEEDEVRRGSQHSSEVDQLQQLRESRLKAETSTFVGGADYERDFHGESVAAESDYQPVEMILPDHPTGQENKKPKSIILPERIVHLDLKGAAPKVAYLKRFFALLNKLGATGILLEYEDVFPWNGELSGNRNGNAYSLEDVRMIIKMAKDNQLKIIPLIQTWGHMEWLLKSAKFSKLREAPKYPQVVCPNHPDTFPVIKAMVDQILAVHKDIDSIHIGCDEAYYVGQCNRCKLKLEELDGSKDRLMIEHVTRVAKYIRKNYSVRVLVWNDMFDKTEPRLMKQSGLSELVEPVIWGYATQLSYNEYFPPGVFDRMVETFPQVWIASAFKGADGPDKLTVDVDRYLRNHKSWLNVLRENPQLVPIVNGVILTGWQRFDHFAILCELLPVAIPSLALNLLTMKEGKYKNALREKVSKMLQCEPTTSLGDEFTAVSEFAQCDYPGSSISVRVEKLAELKLNITKMYQHSSVKGWLTPYNLKALYGHSFFAEKWYNKTVEIREELEAVGVILRQELAEVYHEDTVNEWLYTNIQTDLNRLKELQESVAAIMQKSEFPVRPLSRLRDLEL